MRSMNWVHSQRCDTLYMAETQRRGTILYLALRMYYNDKDELPESLGALVDEGYVDHLPLVPVICRPFCYEPEGGDAKYDAENTSALGWRTAGGIDASFLFKHEKSTPFLWYPFRPEQELNPWVARGAFIDLGFVDDKETE